MAHQIRPRLTIQGYLYMGREQIPPLPQNVVMEDRINGVPYHLTVTGTSPTLSPALTTILPTTPDIRRYGPFEGPYLSGGTIRLYVSSGVLAFETNTELKVQSPRVFMRRGTEPSGVEVTCDGTNLVYTNIDF